MTPASNGKSPTLVASIGEALYDCFAHEEVLGGAPVNLAGRLQQLLDAAGGSCMLVSRIGNDRLGQRLVADLTRRNMATPYLQVDAVRPTGRVFVRLDEQGRPDFDIETEVAWDAIAFDESLYALAPKCEAVCFGTLAQRCAASRGTIHRFLDLAKTALRVLDVNLRGDFYSAEILQASLSRADVVKLNEGELSRVHELLPEFFGASAATDDLMFDLVEAFDLTVASLTRGALGTVLYTRERRIEGQPATFPRSSQADDVGAGDASCAGLVYGLLAGWPLERTLNLANVLGGYVASQPGGSPPLPSMILEELCQV